MDASRFHSQEPQTLGCKARDACSFVKSFNWKHHNTAADRCIRPLWSLQGTFPYLGSLLLLLLPHHVRTATFFSRRRSWGEQWYLSALLRPLTHQHNQNYYSLHSGWPKHFLSHFIFLSRLRAPCHISNYSLRSPAVGMAAQVWGTTFNRDVAVPWPLCQWSPQGGWAQQWHEATSAPLCQCRWGPALQVSRPSTIVQFKNQIFFTCFFFIAPATVHLHMGCSLCE